MKRLAILYVLICGLLIGAWQAFAQITLPTTGAGLGATTSSYTGPGDVAAAVLYYGVRAYSAAKRGTKVLNVCDPSNVSCADFLSNATTGDLVAQTLNGTNCGTADTCIVKTIYEQSGATCSGGSCDQTQATTTKMALLKHNCTTNGKFCLIGSSGNTTAYASVGTITISQGFVASWTGSRDGTDTNGQVIITDTANASTYFEATVSGFRAMFAGSQLDKSDGNDGAIHAVRAVYNGASSSIRIDNGTPATGNPGTNSFNGTINILNQSGASNLRSTSGFQEVQINSGTTADLYSNQSAYYGGF